MGCRPSRQGTTGIVAPVGLASFVLVILARALLINPKSRGGVLELCTASQRCSWVPCYAAEPHVANRESLIHLANHVLDPPCCQVLQTVNAVLTEPMTTRIILRTNFRDGDPGFMDDHVFEISHFSFTPHTA